MVTAVLEAPPPVRARPTSSDDLGFRPSLDPTLGVELELQILSRETGDLAPGAVPLLKACAQEGISGPRPELMQSMFELKTGVCANVAAVRDELTPRLRKIANIARSLGFDLAMS